MMGAFEFTSLYYYDTVTRIWQTTLLPDPAPFVAIASTGDFIVVVASNKKLHIFSIQFGNWNTQPLEFDAIPSTIIHAGNMTIVAGGKSSFDGFYSDVVLTISDDIEFVPPVSPSAEAITPDQVQVPNTGLSDGELAAAIVVPVAVAIAGAIALLLVMLRRRKKATRATTTVGLEQQFGQWFTPFNDVQFGTQLGQGANGQVFKGKWKNTDVALKVSMTEANQSVISELSLMINMRPHPNVVQLLGFSIHPETNSVILILEYCNGGSLDKQLYDQKTNIPMHQKLQLLHGIGRGLSHLHSNNIVHRDIAARNVLLHQGEPKLTDFGMSRLINEQQQRGTTKSELGPIRWMAPESLREKQYSTKSGT